MKIVEQLSGELSGALSGADEIWVAVALMNSQGLDYILALAGNATKHFLLGVSLPTEPRVLRKLFEERLHPVVNVRLDKDVFYHPKVYLARRGQAFTGFIGSANCTSAGLNTNIELSIRIDTQSTCRELLRWFEGRYAKASELTKSYLDGYEVRFQRRKLLQKREIKEAKGELKRLEQSTSSILRERERLTRALRRYRQGANYMQVVRERRAAVGRLRQSLDYPNFDIAKMDIDMFFSIPDLGNIVDLPKPTIKRNIQKFSMLLSALCDENIDVAQRYDDALSGRMKIRGVGEGMVSKILTIHKPDKYGVVNETSKRALAKYGIELPRNSSKGEKYRAICGVLRDICSQTNIKDLSVLDHYLYLKGRKKPTT